MCVCGLECPDQYGIVLSVQACLMRSRTNKHSARSAHSLCTETYKEDGAVSRRSRGDNMIDYKCGQSLFHHR